MKGFRGTVIKEMLILIRDIPGLVLLFVMPMVLIVVITLTQENTYKSISAGNTSLIFVNNDKGELGRTIEKGLRRSGSFRLIDNVSGVKMTTEAANRLIAAGKYQVGIFIPSGASEAAAKRADEIIRISRDSTKGINDVKAPLCSVSLSFDPAILESYRNSVTASMLRLVQAAEFRIMLGRFFVQLPEQLNDRTRAVIKAELIRQLGLMETEFNNELKTRMGEYYPGDLKIEAPDKDPDVDLQKEFGNNMEYQFATDKENLVSVKESYAKTDPSQLQPTLVQNNVPAFALFAMFFIVIPLAGSLITERMQGTYNRLHTLPIKFFTLLAGKTFVYLLVCLSQLGIMVLTGMYLIPMISDLPALETGTSYFSIIIAALSCTFAAIGFGLLVGTVSSSHGQAGMFGAFMVVILAILGGIFLPVYMMPEQLQFFTKLSPIRWGIDAFLDLFVRNGDIRTIWPNILMLNLFFVFALIIAMFNFVKRK